MPEPGIGCDWGGCWPGHGAVCAGHPEAAEEEGGHWPAWLCSKAALVRVSGMLPVEVYQELLCWSI